LDLIPLYSKISPVDKSVSYTLPSEPSDSLNEDDFDFDTTLTVFPETKALDLTTRFRKDADAFYVEAKRSTVSSVAQIPYWIYGMLVVLGWNEAMVVLFNPLYFALLLLAAGTG
jgi:protein SEY1